MKRLIGTGAKQSGYTIVETLIVFAASAVLLLTVIALINGQQGKTEFAQSVRDADSRLQDIINDFSTGYYDRNNNVACTTDDTGGAPSLSPVASALGTNVKCAYVGRLVQFTGADGFTLHTIAGRQFTGAIFSQEVSTLLQAKPRLIYRTTADSSIPDLSRSDVFNGHMNVGKVVYVDASGVEQTTGVFGVISNFGSTSGNNLQTNKQSPQLIAITTHQISGTALQLSDKIANLTSADFVTARPVAVCFLSTKSNQYAVIRIGDNQGRLTTTTYISGGGACPADLIP